MVEQQSNVRAARVVDAFLVFFAISKKKRMEAW
jgi:hypothetical protein